MAETFAAIDHDRPVCFLAYTVKLWGTPIAGHKVEHGGLMTRSQTDAWQAHMNVPKGQEWDRFAATPDAHAFRAFLDTVPSFAAGPCRLDDRRLPVPAISAPATGTLQRR
jgi:pyruvate dehydrogenase E1 component